ncbi:MAG: hypothetical protein MZW92_12375 [Comamonadaceae bacterium]|nr:hypothetical protein [Comamonadaceae bacterium]
MMLEHGWGDPFASMIPDQYLLYVLIHAAVAVGGERRLPSASPKASGS